MAWSTYMMKKTYKIPKIRVKIFSANSFIYIFKSANFKNLQYKWTYEWNTKKDENE